MKEKIEGKEEKEKTTEVEREREMRLETTNWRVEIADAVRR